MTTTFTFDLIFSYWLDAWFIAWIISRLIESSSSSYIPNPAAFLAFGLSQNWLFLSRMFYNNTPTKWIYLGQSILLKFIPLCYAVYKFPQGIQINKEIRNSLTFGGGLFLAYTVYLWCNGTTPWSLYFDMNKSILSGEVNTPFMRVVSALS